MRDPASGQHAVVPPTEIPRAADAVLLGSAERRAKRTAASRPPRPPAASVAAGLAM